MVKRYGSITAVDGVSLDIAPGEFVSFLGPSGSGKTTTLQMIAGFTDLDEGMIELGGSDLARIPTHKRDIGVVFQNYALFPHLTVRQNVGFSLKMRGMSRGEIARRVNEVLEKVHLGPFADRKPAALSGGQQQRVALARAVVFQPRLLLMDEPLGALDRKLRELLQMEITRIARDLDVTVVFVTHDQEEALAMSDRIAIFNQGRIEQIGSGPDLYERPQSLFVATFMGDSNILGGRLIVGGGGRDYGVSSPLGSFRGVTPAPDRLSAADESVKLVVRPEHIRVANDSSLDSRVRARVLQSVYLGTTLRVVTQVEGFGEFHALVPASSTASPRPGDEVTLSWSSEDAIILADTQAANLTGLIATQP